MKTLNYMKIFLLSILVLGLVSCEDDEQYSIESALIGRSWTGDVGMDAHNGEPIFSTFTFGGDGFGEENQYYASDGRFYNKYRFQWMWEDRHSLNLILDYGREGVSYMEDLSISGTKLYGTFFVEDGFEGFCFTLIME